MRHHTVKDLIQDFLEVACRLDQEHRLTVLEALKEEDILSEHLEVHPAFSIDGRVVVIVDTETIRECFYYFPARKKVERQRLVNTES